jgi:hypothetical protein
MTQIFKPAGHSQSGEQLYKMVETELSAKRDWQIVPIGNAPRIKRCQRIILLFNQSYASVAGLYYINFGGGVSFPFTFPAVGAPYTGNILLHASTDSYIEVSEFSGPSNITLSGVFLVVTEF